ncbi:hypothetical protein MRX96_001780 [Rhipicephalus microplus]
MAIVPRMKLSTRAELAVCVSCAVYVVYYILVVVRKPRLVCRAGRLRRFLSANMDEFIKSYYWAPIWCFGGNLQFLFGCLYNSWLPRLSYRRELFVLSDRGLVALDWVNEEQPGPVVILAGGGFSDSQSRPWRALLPALATLGCPCVVVNGRGCGVPLTTHRITYVASVSDIAEVADEVHRRYPQECVVGVGVSLGGLQMALYLSQWGPRAQLDAVVAVSAPFQLGLASRNLGRWGTNMLLKCLDDAPFGAPPTPQRGDGVRYQGIRCRQGVALLDAVLIQQALRSSGVRASPLWRISTKTAASRDSWTW